MAPTADLHRALMEPLAQRAGLDYDREMLSPEDGPAQSAFQFVACGALLLTQFADPDSFPSSSKKVSKRAAKAVRKACVSDAGRRASIFLAHALATFQREFYAAHDNDAASRRNERHRKILAEHYPLGTEELEVIEKAQQEYRSLADRVIPDPVKAGHEMGTGFHMMLRDPTHADGFDGGEGAMVEIQQTYARKYFQSIADRHALETVLGTQSDEIANALPSPGGMHQDLFVTQAVESELWNWIIEQHWRGFSMVAAHLTDLPALSDPAAQSLRQAVEVLWKHGATLDAAVSTAINSLADNDDRSEADVEAALDALILGYRLREVECEGDGWNLHGPDEVAFLAETAEEQGRDFAIAVGAVSVADSVSHAFSHDDATWFALSQWATREARQNALIRQDVSDNDLEDLSIADDDLGEAFALGYGVRFCEQTLAGGQDDDGRDPLDLRPSYQLPPISVDSHEDAVALLMQTESVLVQIGMPMGLIGLLLTSLTKGAGLDVDAPYGAAFLVPTLFGYACRLAQDLPPPLRDNELLAIDVIVDDDGSISLEPLDDDALGAAIEWVLALAQSDDLLRHAGCTADGWSHFRRLARKQLAMNMRRAGMPRRKAPDPFTISELINVGYAAAMLHDALVAHPTPQLGQIDELTDVGGGQADQPVDPVPSPATPAELGLGSNALRCPECGTVLLGGEKQLAHHRARKHSQA